MNREGQSLYIRIIPRAAEKVSWNPTSVMSRGSASRSAAKVMTSALVAAWGRASSLPARNMSPIRMALQTEGCCPTSMPYTGRKAIAKISAEAGEDLKRTKKNEIRSIIIPMLNPESATR